MPFDALLAVGEKERGRDKSEIRGIPKFEVGDEFTMIGKFEIGVRFQNAPK